MENLPTLATTKARRRIVVIAGLIVLVGCSLFRCTTALAEFSRSFEMALPGTPTGSLNENVPFQELESIATDETSEGKGQVWISDHRFSTPPTGDFVDELTYPPLTFVNRLSETELNIGAGSPIAFDDRTGVLYSASQREWIAVDNALDSHNGDVYFAGSNLEHDIGGMVRRFIPHEADAQAEPAPFECTAPNASEYIKGNELIGTPSGPWKFNAVSGIAVDSSSEPSHDTYGGNIYVVNQIGTHEQEIDEFNAEGCFVRAVTGADVPGGFGVYMSGIAIDPTNGDILVETVEGSENNMIDEFTSSGEYLSRLTGTSREPEDQFTYMSLEVGSIAVSSDGELYVGNNESKAVDVFGPGAFYPSAVTGKASAAQHGSMTLNGVVRGTENNSHASLELSECYFQYVTQEAYEKGGFPSPGSGNKVACELESGVSPEGQRLSERNSSVHAETTDLLHDTAYRYRLVAATNSAEHGGVRVGEAESFVLPDMPAVTALSVQNVSSTYADLHAEVDPRGTDTTYRFQYVDASTYDTAVTEGASNPYAAGGSVPVPAADVGSSDNYVSVAASVGGLQPGTSYDFRIVAVNELGEATSGGGAFTTMPASGVGLPDGRAYEMLTPPDKGDAEDLFGEGEEESNFDEGYASEDGEHFMLFTAAKFGSFPASGENSYVFTRDATGWSEVSVASPSLGVQSAFVEVCDPFDFSRVGIHDDVGSTEQVVDDLVGSSGNVNSYEMIASGTKEEYVHLVGASRDLSHVVVEGTDHNLPLCEPTQEGLAMELNPNSRVLYELSSARKCLSLVAVKSGGLLSKCGAVLGQSTERAGGAHDAISADGARIFFTAPDPRAKDDGSGCWGNSGENAPQLYMHSGKSVVEVSAPAKGVSPPGGVLPAVFVGASAEGSRVFFVSRSELTAGAVAAHTHGPELYEYDTETRNLARISSGESGQDEGNVIFVAAVSADGSTVYFDAAGKLTANAPEGRGLYRYDTATGKTTYLAAGAGYPGFTPGKWYQNEVVSANSLGLEVPANDYTTADGEFLVFESTGDVTGYDSAGQAELYRYDRGDGSIVCVSCDPNGESPHAGAEFARSALRADNPAGGPPRPVSENGEYVFFDTAESLVPQDTNGKINVYEWHNGEISLITTGQSASSSFFLGSSSYVNTSGETVEGGNLFFGTHSQLVPQDTDTEGDLYDARIGGGFGGETALAPCEGDACENQQQPPVLQTPASFTSASSGNIPPPVIVEKSSGKRSKKCKAGKRQLHGMCVRVATRRVKKGARRKAVRSRRGSRR